MLEPLYLSQQFIKNAKGKKDQFIGLFNYLLPGLDYIGNSVSTYTQAQATI
jgi:hypothetical protein